MVQRFFFACLFLFVLLAGCQPSQHSLYCQSGACEDGPLVALPFWQPAKSKQVKFEYHGDGKYSLEVYLKKGLHSFKIGVQHGGFHVETDKPLPINKDLSLVQGVRELTLKANKAGMHVVSLDFSNLKKATLSIRLQAKQAASLPKVHQYHKASQRISLSKDRGKTRELVVSANREDYKQRRYALSLNQGGKIFTRRYEEQNLDARVRTGSLQFDALFALAMHELRQHEKKMPTCDCYFTDYEKLRLSNEDMAIATDLALGLYTPERAMASLQQLLIKQKGGLQIVDELDGNETSADRLIWVLGASKAMANLSRMKREQVADRVYQAIKNSIAIDRKRFYGGKSGLYQLDAYPPLSDALLSPFMTNVIQFYALKFASDFAQDRQDLVGAIKYQDWGFDLKAALKQEFWLGQDKSFSAAKLETHHLLLRDHFASALAASHRAVDVQLAKQYFSRIKNKDFGRRYSYFPSAVDKPLKIDQNVWPHILAYSLISASKLKLHKVADTNYRSLIDFPSEHLSMPGYSSRVKSSSQLKAVAAHLAMVTDALFGIKISLDGLVVDPFITTQLHREQFPKSRQLKLYGLKLHGNTVDVRIVLPEKTDKGGYYAVNTVNVNGRTHRNLIAWRDLQTRNQITVHLGEVKN